jgi:hypothetical protein
MTSFRNATLAGVLFALAAGAVCLVGCGKSEPTAPEPTATSSAPGTGAARITAEPNPVPAGMEKYGTTTITWDTGDGTPGVVYVSINGEPEKGFSRALATGSKAADWIGNKASYEFRLYSHAGKEKKTMLASVKVTRAASDAK